MMVIRKIESDKVRNMCIKNNYYTCGDCTAYDRMFHRIRIFNERDYSDFNVSIIAKDILEHSDAETICEKYGISTTELYESILFELLNNCVVALVYSKE